jgi:hypothetical protein
MTALPTKPVPPEIQMRRGRVAGGLCADAGFAAGFAADVGFVGFAGFAAGGGFAVVPGFAAGLIAGFGGVAALAGASLAGACLAVALWAVPLLVVAGFPGAFVGALTLGAIVDVAVERREARFSVGFGFGSVTAAPPRDAVDQ